MSTIKPHCCLGVLDLRSEQTTEGQKKRGEREVLGTQKKKKKKEGKRKGNTKRKNQNNCKIILVIIYHMITKRCIPVYNYKKMYTHASNQTKPIITANTEYNYTIFIYNI